MRKQSSEYTTWAPNVASSVVGYLEGSHRVFVLWVLRCCEGGGCSGSGALAAAAAAALVAVLGLSLFLSISLSLSVSLSFSLSCCHTLAIFVAKVMDLPHTPCQPERTLLNPSIGHAFLVFCSLVSLSLSLCPSVSVSLFSELADTHAEAGLLDPRATEGAGRRRPRELASRQHQC